MTSTPLFTVGTPFGSWLPLANALLSSARSDGEALQSPANADVWGGLDLNACWTLDVLSAEFPQARFLIFVESAAHALGAWLHQGNGEADVDQALQRWRAAVERILRHAQRHLPRCLLVDSAEARANPAALAVLCTERFGIAFDTPHPPANAVDAVAVALGAGVAKSDTRIMALQAELHASCVPLSEDDAAAKPDPFRGVDATAAFNGWHRLQSTCSELRSQLETSNATNANLHRDMQALQSRLDEVNRQSDDQHRALAALRAEHDVCRRGGEALRDRIELGDRVAASLRQELEQARQETATSKQDAELVLLQLHHVQGELEHYYLAWQVLQELPKALGCHVERVEFGRERDVPPHRDLDVTLHGVHAEGQTLATVQARLVEHHGRPGLALFAAPGQPTPLMAWQPNGSEDGRDYLLLVPADALAVQRLQNLGCGDWALLMQIVDAMVAALQAQGGDATRHWRVAAERLHAQLATLPERLRYDRIDVSAASDAPQAIDARLAPVSFGKRLATELRLRWWPGAPEGGAVELFAGAEPMTPPLVHWPLDADGRWAPRWRLPLGELARAERGRAWRSLAQEDRALLLGVLDALPAVAERASAQLGTAVGSASELTMAAARPLRAAQRALNGSRARRVWRALRGRIA